jgi:multimeric flavodoxin WrbA
MKILLISASPRKEKSQTFLLAKEALKGLGVSAKVEIIHLCDHDIKFCQNLEECHKKILHCSVKDDVTMLLKKMLDADGIILASPNYINQVTASMKALFDRSSHFIHCKRLMDKYIVGVVSSGSGRDTAVLDYIKHYSNACGAQYAGGVSSGVPISDDKKQEAIKLGKALITAIEKRASFPDQIKFIEMTRGYFKAVMEKRKHEWAEEYQYWKDKGWL